jgi:hypothetical protein
MIWNVPVRFFADHASNPEGPRLWRAVFETEGGAWTANYSTEQPARSNPAQSQLLKWSTWYVDGIWETEQQPLTVSAPRESNFLPRPRNEDEKYVFNGSTRISCWTGQKKDKRHCESLSVPWS